VPCAITLRSVKQRGHGLHHLVGKLPGKPASHPADPLGSRPPNNGVVVAEPSEEAVDHVFHHGLDVEIVVGLGLLGIASATGESCGWPRTTEVIQQ